MDDSSHAKMHLPLLVLEEIRIEISYPGGQPLTLGQVSFAPESGISNCIKEPGRS
jgi:hypothetical protein